MLCLCYHLLISLQLIAVCSSLQLSRDRGRGALARAAAFISIDHVVVLPESETGRLLASASDLLGVQPVADQADVHEVR